jgi:DNA-binding CsgD family transcriptional regulator
MTVSATDAYHRDLLIERALEADSVSALFGDASRRLKRLLPFDAALWVATDPATALPTAPTLAENVRHADARTCLAFWEHEFLNEDVNLFRNLARADTPVATLRRATRDRPARSGRYREVVRPVGFGDELRAVLRVDGSPWAYVNLWRHEGAAAFDAADAALVAGLTTPLAEAVRNQAQAPARPADPREPGLMLYGPDGGLFSANDSALAWLDEVSGDWAPESSFGVSLPNVVAGILMRARAIAQEREHGVARARLRSTATGQWLVCHASCLRDASGEIASTALVIEPAKGSEIAPIIVEAYDLSPREQQITRLVAQGAATAEIAGRLHLSAHTVRDYLKTIFEKVGVASRGELVAKLFAEHYAPAHLDPGNVDVA